MSTKYIFVTGGVVSGLGKGITAASLGRLLKARGFRVTIQKFDPYINVDSGTLNPYQHGEVFVTRDGAETDLDLGHYERFIDENLDNTASVTTGKVYQAVIQRERNGEYNGSTVQVVPHITDEIQRCVLRAAKDVDIVITEIGGTVGDIESQPFLEALRQLKVNLPKQDCCFIHVTLLPIIFPSKEIKTKPTQHSVRELSSMGIQPDFLICRCETRIPAEHREKIALQCSVKNDHVIQNTTVASIYEVPLMLEREEMASRVCEDLGLESAKPDMSEWEAMVKRILNPQGSVEIALCGKYIDLHDSYLSVVEALQHAGIAHNLDVKIRWVEADSLNKDNVDKRLEGAHGILIPGGFGDRGGEGKMQAATYARINNIPYFGLCLGLHIAVSEFARNVAHLSNANTTEFDPKTPYPVIHIMPEQQGKQIGGTMRLGAQPCKLEKDSIACRSYGEELIYERHRHRYEVNNEYVDILESNGMRFTGINPEKGLIEIIELDGHPWFVGVQFHPEFLSRPNRPHPLFKSFIGAADKIRRSRG